MILALGLIIGGAVAAVAGPWAALAVVGLLLLPIWGD